MTRRDTLRMLGLGALGVSGAVACAPSGAIRRGGGDTGAKNFQFLSWSLSEDGPKPVITDLVSGYASDKKVKIKTNSYPYDEYLKQLTLQIRGNEFVGAAQLDIAWLGAVAATGTLADLGKGASAHPYTDTALASGKYQGKQLGLPWVTGSIGLLGNSELLKKAGVDSEPATIAEFESALRKIKAHDSDLIPYAGMTHVDHLKDILVWMQQFGCTLVENGETTIGDDASVEAVSWYKSLYDKKLIAPDVDRFAARTLFAQGKTAMYEDAIIAKGVVIAESPDKKLGDKLQPLARPVQAAGDPPQGVLWGHLIVVVSGDGQQAATDLASWLTGDTETGVAFFEKLGLPPTTEDALSADAVAQDTFTTTWTEKITANATPSPFWAYPNYAQIEATVAEQTQSVLIGDASPAKAMKTAREKILDLMG